MDGAAVNKLCYGVLALSALLTPLSASVQFDGSNDLINAGSATSLDDLGPVTFSFWMRTRSLGEGNLGRVLDKGGSFHGIQLTSPNRVVFVKDYATTDLRRESDDNSVVVGVWQHWAITYGGGASATSIKMFIDGVEQTVYQGQSDAAGSYVSDAANDLIIGNRAAADRTFDGDLAELAIWDAVLSNAEIEHLAQHRPRTPLQVRRSSLVAYWTLSEFAYGQAVTGLVLETSGNGHHGTPSNSPTGGGWFLSRGAPATPAPDPDPQPWELTFTALRTHYVSTSGSGNGDIGTPESISNAIGHCQAGDLHILRGGAYSGAYNIACDGTSSNPIVWKGFIDSDGNPEKAQFTNGIDLDGDWNWVWSIFCGENGSDTGSNGCVALDARGTAIINSVVQDYKSSMGVEVFNFGPDQVIYGTVLINNGTPGDIPPPHNLYAQNSDSNGIKYFVQLISLDQASGSDTLRFNFHAFTQSGSIQNMHIQDGVFQRGRVIWRKANYGNENVEDIVLDNMLFDTLDINTKVELGGSGLPIQYQITDSLFRNTEIQSLATLGAGDGCIASYPPPTKFTGNRVYSPNGGNYINFQTRIHNGSCNGLTSGSPKIRDLDEWDNNTYGPSAAGNTWKINANGTNSGAVSLANWRSASDAARQTAGGTAFDASSTEGALPTSDEIHCFDNFYQPGWGYCWGIDWSGNGAITITGTEADKIVGNGKTYKVRNVRDFHGTPVKECVDGCTYTAGAGLGAITLPADAVNGVLIVWITSQP